MIAGDSWGCGEWNLGCSNLLHLGLQQNLIEDGHQVCNISKGGISNLDMIYRLSAYFERLDQQLPDLILVFQTEYCRDFKHDVMQTDFFGSDDWKDVKEIAHLRNRYIERFYFRLSEISMQISVPIKIIGGCSDTMHFDDMSKDYLGCDIACQSLTNLILSGNDRISNPVFSWYGKAAINFVKKIHGVLSTKSLVDFLDEIDRGFERECLLKEHPEFFYPDGKHPNRVGHKILFDFLKSQKILN